MTRTTPEADFGDPEADFGNFVAEHEALVETAGLLNESDRRIVRIRGEKARRMVGGLVSNHLAPLDRNHAVYSFLLTPKGRPIAEVRILPSVLASGPAQAETRTGDGEGEPGREREDEIWLDTPAACLESLLEHLRKYLPPIYARFELHPSARRLGLVGPAADRVVASAAAALDWAEPPDTADPSPLAILAPRPRAAVPGAAGEGLPLLVRREELEGPGWDLYLPAPELPARWRALEEAVRAEGGRAAGRRAWEVLRVERGIPAYGSEIGLDVLPQETGQEGRAVSIDKGCYTGQEVVARIHYRGKVNRLLRGLSFKEVLSSGEAPPSSGAELYREGRAVGRVTTAVRSPRLGAIALGYVRREVSPGDRVALAAEGPEAVPVVALPFTDK